MANKWTREKIKIPTTLKPRERVAIAEVILTHIVSRTLAGEDRYNDKFKKYTKKYADIKGVGVDDVDLVLSGEMLDALELVSHKNGEIVIGYKDPDDGLAGKVEGNRRGSYGGDPNPKRARDFLGIDTDDLEVLLSAYEENDNPVSGEDLDLLARELADELLDEA